MVIADAKRACLSNGMAVVEFEGGAVCISRTMAHGHETSTEMIGTTGKLCIGVSAPS